MALEALLRIGFSWAVDLLGWWRPRVGPLRIGIGGSLEDGGAPHDATNSLLASGQKIS